MPELDQLNLSTRRYIRDNPALVDNFFQNDPLLAYLKLNVKVNYSGGSKIAENFYYDGLIGGGYRPGKEFNITEKQVEQQKQFNMKFAEWNVTLSKEDVQVLNKGPLAVFKLVDSRMSNAYMSAGAGVAVAQYLNGIRTGYEANPNGLAEMLNDGTTVSWDSNAYATYGDLTRNGTIGQALNSVPVSVNGPITYNTLENTYGAAEFGNIQPNLGVTTVKGYSFIKERFQTQQRFNDTQDPAIGFNGLKFNACTLIKSRYAPGADIATVGTQSNREAVEYLTETSNGAITAYPTLAVAVVGSGDTAASETLWWLNARQPFLNFYLSDDPEFGFGFTGFKPAQGNTKVAGQVLVAYQITGEPRYHKQLYGITGV